MAEKSFAEILRMVLNACDEVFSLGRVCDRETVLECATQIYVAQMKGGYSL